VYCISVLATITTMLTLTPRSRLRNFCIFIRFCVIRFCSRVVWCSILSTKIPNLGNWGTSLETTNQFRSWGCVLKNASDRCSPLSAVCDPQGTVSKSSIYEKNIHWFARQDRLQWTNFESILLLSERVVRCNDRGQRINILSIGNSCTRSIK
jgi:hypothetical protein